MKSLLAVALSIFFINGKTSSPLYLANENISSQVKITYLTRSGWLVETESHLLLFDYVPYEGKNYDDFLQLEFDKAVKNNKKLFIFISHEHEDHFYTKLLNWDKKYSGLKIILGWNYESSQTDLYKISGREEKMIDDVKVITHPANDAGSGFLVLVDGKTIYHAGDHALWLPSIKEDYLKEINYIKEKATKIDFAFVPVENKRKHVMEGAIETTKILKSAHVFPMHSKFEAYKIFAASLKQTLSSASVHYPKKNKDVFNISK